MCCAARFENSSHFFSVFAADVRLKARGSFLWFGFSIGTPSFPFFEDDVGIVFAGSQVDPAVW